MAESERGSLPDRLQTGSSHDGVRAAIQSPLTSVQQLLADTSAAPPPATSPTTSTAPSLPSLSFKDAKDSTTSTSNTASSSQPAASNGKEPITFNAYLADLRNFLLPFLKLLPFQSLQAYLKRFVGPFVRFIVRVVAKILYRWDVGLASNIAYDVHILLWKWVINLFFREIRPRGAWRVPRSGPVLFVCGPHHNQFLDPLLLMSEVRLSANRRVAFLMAEKSYHLSFIGLAGKIAHSIPVARAADQAVAGKGRLYLTESSKEEAIVRGSGTNFLKQLVPKGQIQLEKSYGSDIVEVIKVIDDESVKVKKIFAKESAVKDLLAAGEKKKRGEDGAGLKYKCLPYIDQAKMYASVYKKLSDGGCIGIFPEGGSHDRTDFLPLRAGLAIMALGAMADKPDLRVTIVPVGLNYFHAHRFRSRAVIEFGAPIPVPTELATTFAKGGADKREAVASLMSIVFDGLKSVTVRTPDYETLMVIQASRRLYKPPGHQLNLSQVVDLNKKFIMGYNAYREEPRVKDLYKKVEKYNKTLRQLGLKDHQVEGARRPVWKALVLLFWRAGLISAWTIMALPGIVLNAPIFIAASIISARKAKEALAASTVKIRARDVMATWKVLVSLAGAPILYSIYTIIAMYAVFKYDLGRKYVIFTPLFMLIAVPTFGYSALRFGEVGMDIYKSLPPLFKSLLPWQHQDIDQLRTQRSEIAQELSEVIEEFAPKLWKDFDSQRMIPHSEVATAYSSAASPPGTPRGTSEKRRSTFGQESSILQHPMSWIDEKLFGWSASRTSRRTRSVGGGEATPIFSEPTTPGGTRSDGEADPADYDEVVRGVELKLQDITNGTGRGDSTTPSVTRLQRRSSYKAKSQLNLTELVPPDGLSTTVQNAGRTE